MATVIEGTTGRDVYPDLVAYIIEKGVPRTPRGLATLDLGPTAVMLASPLDALPLMTGRGLNLKIAAVEAVQLIGGFSDPKLVDFTSVNFRQFQDNGRFHGAYGERINTQMAHVIRKLTDDPDTRQAIITLWNPRLDNVPGMHDYPCTIALGFSMHLGCLDMTTMMRSNDVWLGTPYDWFQFTQLQMTIANILGVNYGTYTHFALSMHMYETDVAKAAALIHGPLDVPFTPLGFPARSAASEVMHRARHIAYEDLPDMTQSELWYREQFRDYHG